MPSDNCTLIKGARRPPVRVWHDNVDIVITQDNEDGARLLMLTTDQAEQLSAAITRQLHDLKTRS